ncbi:bifunctional glycosyltransferase family 2/GtrA family protein [Brachybacterium equifaecis]|uniref:bifunctional glycosyltransferase family 2/GtrA family protein n=1 Tax=Brachybacterium equifaecis TaxID=2910770 RepID=UPI0024BEFCB4|nr:bifunctional glycosyltransferase family 2/GtrA family protein [Brachybacterium equifaecis]
MTLTAAAPAVAPAPAAAPATAAAPAPAAGTAQSAAPAVVVIPALEPGHDLVVLVSSLLASGTDVVVIDDGSGSRFDVVFDRCELQGAHVLRLPENHGKGYALRTAFAFVREEFPGAGVVTADADGQHRLADIAAVRALLDSPATLAGVTRPIVLGVRTFDKDDVPLRSRLGNAVSALLFRAASGTALGDTQTGLRGIPAEHLEWAQSLPGDRYEYEYTMLVRASREGIGLAQVPIETVYTEENATSHFRPVRDSLRVMGPVLAFAGSGVLAFAVDTGLFLAFTALGAPLWLALGAARVVSGGINFSVNRWGVFGGGAQVPLRQAAVRYAALAGAVLAGGIAAVDALAAMGVPLVVAKILADAGLFALSYLAQRFLVFGRRAER